MRESKPGSLVRNTDRHIPKKKTKNDASLARAQRLQRSPSMTMSLQEPGVWHSSFHLCWSSMQTNTATTRTLWCSCVPLSSSLLPVHTFRGCCQACRMSLVDHFSWTPSITHSFDQFPTPTGTRDKRNMPRKKPREPNVALVSPRPEPLQGHLNRLSTTTSTETFSSEQSLQTRFPIRFRTLWRKVACHRTHRITNSPWKPRMQSPPHRFRRPRSKRTPPPSLGSS